MKKEPYTCIRCGYNINDKSAMNKHLYKINTTKNKLMI